MTTAPERATVEAAARNSGYAAGHRRGVEDRAAEALGRSTRDPSHRGHDGEPPALPAGELAVWTDGFLGGYACGRDGGGAP